MFHLKGKGSFFEEISTHYFNTLPKRVEFALCMVLYILFLILQISPAIPDEIRGMPAQVQSFVAIYTVIRFGYMGFSIVSILSFFEMLHLLQMYSDTHHVNVLIGLTLKLFLIISTYIVAILANKQEMQRRKLQALAITDELTDAYNRRYFHSILGKEIEKAKKEKSTVGLILVDIDNFRMCNDLFGHSYGDDILKGTASLLNDSLTRKGFVFRYGGDEFAVILSGADIEAIESVAQRIRENLRAMRENYYHQCQGHKVTLSMGLSQYPNMADSQNELISQADMALTHAKNLGKDNVHFYQDILLQLRKSLNSDQQQLIGIFKGLLSSISAKDQYTLMHSERVSAYAVMIGKKLNLSPQDIRDIQYAGLLHDIGKIEIPKSILNKVEHLTDEEFEIIRMHPVYSANILEPLEGMNKLIDYVKHHHERFDGKGYPDRLAGKEISLGARILCVADSFDAMVSIRPYGRIMTKEEALHELARCAGAQFDPEVVRVFTEAMREEPEWKPAQPVLSTL